jgi:hypothetical protein
MIDNKKLKTLVVCKETYAYPMNFVKDELINRGHQVEALFIHLTEPILKEHSYTSFCERNSEIPIHTCDSIAMEFWNNYDCAKEHIDYDYLRNVEQLYCETLPIGLMMMSSQLFTTPYHYRFYFKDMTEHEKLYWLQLLFIYFEKIIEECNPNRIVDIDNAELGRTVLSQIARVKGIPYVTLESSRFKSIWLPTYTLGRTTDNYFIDLYNKTINSSDIDQKYKYEVDEFRKAESIMMIDYKYNNTSKSKSLPFYKDAKRTLLIVSHMSKEWFRNYRYSGVFTKKPLIASYFHSILFFLLWFFRERYLFSRFSKYFKKPVEGEKYVYFPLHLIPESTTLNKSPFYPNELSVIEAIAKSLPLNWKLYVKEHGTMIGERPLSFYKYIQRLSNVRLMELDYYNDPKPWILNAVGVVTLSGSSAFEAAMLGKKSIIFGNTFFEVMEGIEKIHALPDLPKMIRNFEQPLTDNSKSCAAYLQAISQAGAYIPLAEILKQSEDTMKANGIPSKELSQKIANLVDVLLSNSEGNHLCVE